MSRVSAKPQAQTQTRPAAQPTPAVAPIPHEKIAQRAYDKWVKRGCTHGSHAQDWAEAEAELSAEAKSPQKQSATPAARR